MSDTNFDDMITNLRAATFIGEMISTITTDNDQPTMGRMGACNFDELPVSALFWVYGYRGVCFVKVSDTEGLAISRGTYVPEATTFEQDTLVQRLDPDVFFLNS